MFEYAELPNADDLSTAGNIVRSVLGSTHQYRWPLIETVVGGECWIKHENHMPTGAFKVRGGVNYVRSLLAKGRTINGLITATRGNHGQSLAFAAAQHRIPLTVVVPHGNSLEKNAAMRALGADVIEEGEDFQESLELAAQLAGSKSLWRVPSFDKALVAGVATWSLELLRELPHLRYLYVPIGLGSGVCGAIAAAAALRHNVEVVGVVSDCAPAYSISLGERRPVSHSVSSSIADGMLCRTPDTKALEIMMAAGLRTVLVRNDQIEESMRLIFSATHNAAEGAGAAALAGLLADSQRDPSVSCAAVLSGGNVDSSSFARVLMNS